MAGTSKSPPYIPHCVYQHDQGWWSGGVLDTVLKRLANYLAEIQELKEYLLSAMIYPVILGLTAIGSIAVMLTVVVPRFAEIFSGLGVDLPLATNIMLATGNFLQANWWILLSILAVILLLFRYAINT